MTATSLLPPPPPSPVADEPATERPRTALAVLAIIGVVAALVFGLLWITASANLDDAEQERDLALSERDAATAFGIELSNELQSTRNQLADAEAALSAAAPSESSTADPSEISDLEANVERLTAEVDRLTTENETLQADLEAARSSSATTVAAETTVAPKTTDAPETTIAAPPTAAPTEAVLPSTLEIGAWLSSLYRSSVLGPGQNECLGRAVLDDLGPDQVSGILASGGDAADNDVLIASLRVAASACGIDPSAVFG